MIVSLLMFSAGCSDRGELNDIFYKMVNNSGHKITIAAEDRYFPAEVILQDGESYEWQTPVDISNSSQPFHFRGKGEIRVEYDDSYVVVFGPEGSNRRSPEFEGNYVKEKIGKHTYLYTYTFTEEDYAYAVNQ